MSFRSKIAFFIYGSALGLCLSVKFLSMLERRYSERTESIRNMKAIYYPQLATEKNIEDLSMRDNIFPLLTQVYGEYMSNIFINFLKFLTDGNYIENMDNYIGKKLSK